MISTGNSVNFISVINRGIEDFSKKVELLVKVHDHVLNKFVKGFRMLTLGWSDGNTFLPVCFSLLSPTKKENRYNEANAQINKKSDGYKIRQEAIKTAPEVMLGFLKQAKTAGIKARYVLFDSWFALLSTIFNVKKQGFRVVCMLKDMHKVFYGYNDEKKGLSDLYSTFKKRRGKAEILASVVVTIYSDAKELKVKIVFVRDRHRSKNWLALLTTDLQLPDEEVVRIYGKRWSIEAFFRTAKSFLQLAKEF